MPSITFVNMDGDSKSFDLEETSNQDALLGGFDHLDKSIKKENKTNEMDLDPSKYNCKLYDRYIHGSAEVVGLMCLKVFVSGDKNKYEKLKKYAMSLGSAFQKVNFLREKIY